MQSSEVIPASKPANRLAGRDCSRLKYLVCANIPKAGQEFILRSFPAAEFTYQGDKSNTTNPHQVSAAIRQLMETEAYIRLSRTGPVNVIDVGGNVRRGQSRAALAGCGYHACCPIMSNQDVVREFNRQEFNALSGGIMKYCNHTWQECQCTSPDIAVMIDSIYYFSSHDLARCLLRTSKRMAYVTYHHFPGDGEFAVPSADLVEGIATVSDGYVVMSMNGSTRSYRHKNFNWPGGVRTTVIDGVVYSLIEEVLITSGTYRLSQIFLVKGFSGDEIDQAALINFHPLTIEMIATKNLTKEMVEVRVARYLLRNPDKGNPRTLTKLVLKELQGYGDSVGRTIVSYSFWDYISDLTCGCLPQWDLPSWRTPLGDDHLWRRYENCKLEFPTPNYTPQQQPMSVPTLSTIPADQITMPPHGDLTLHRDYQLKPGRDWARVAGIENYRPPRPSRDPNNYLNALQTRVGKLPDIVDHPLIAKSLLSAGVWKGLKVGMMSLDEWLSTYYGQRMKKDKVRSYKEAAERIQMRPITGDCLHIDAFIKDELYPGKVEDFKTRLVMNCANTAEVVRPALFTASLSQAIKASQTPKDPLVYSGGFNPIQLGEWFDTWALPGWVAVENDFSSFEGSISSSVLDGEFQFYQSLGCPDVILQDFKRQKKVVMNLPIGTYRRTGSRMSGVPNTSIGNSWVNASIHKYILDKAGKRLGTDYAMIVQGDDNLILCFPDCAQVLAASPTFREFGFFPEIKIHYNVWDSEFCSCRFIATPSGPVFTPKVGRLLAKGLEVPLNCDTISYLKPVMNHYYNTSASTMIRYYAYSWLRNVGFDLKEPTLSTEELSFYGVTAQDYKSLFPRVEGPKLIIPMNGVTESILEKDCPLDYTKITRDYAPVEYQAPSKPKCNQKHELTMYLERAKDSKVPFDTVEVWEDFDSILI